MRLETGRHQGTRNLPRPCGMICTQLGSKHAVTTRPYIYLFANSRPQVMRILKVSAPLLLLSVTFISASDKYNGPIVPSRVSGESATFI